MPRAECNPRAGQMARPAIPIEKRANARFVGSAIGYSVYTTREDKFAEFILAVREAILQNPQVAKTGASNPPLVQLHSMRQGRKERGVIFRAS